MDAPPDCVDPKTSTEYDPKCPNCGDNNDNLVADSRHHKFGIRRRRNCACGHRWTTYEVPADTLDKVDAAIEAISKIKEMISSVMNIEIPEPFNPVETEK